MVPNEILSKRTIVQCEKHILFLNEAKKSEVGISINVRNNALEFHVHESLNTIFIINIYIDERDMESF